MVNKIVIAEKLPTIPETKQPSQPTRPPTPPPPPTQPPPPPPPPRRRPKRDRSDDSSSVSEVASRALILVQPEVEEEPERPAKGRRFSSSTSIHSKSNELDDTLEDEFEKEYLEFLNDQSHVQIDLGDHILFPDQGMWEVSPSTPESQQVFERID